MGQGDVKAAILKGNQQLMAAFGRRDAAAVAELYAPGAQVLPPHSDFVTGAEAIRQFWQGAMDMGIRQAKLETVEVESTDNTAVEVGRFTLFLEGGKQADAGKYLVVWKKQGGTWKLYRDIWNTSQPAQ
jgi:uncharacterized protein (TIGR02246 family)